jgi:hypothetical protein
MVTRSSRQRAPLRAYFNEQAEADRIASRSKCSFLLAGEVLGMSLRGFVGLKRCIHGMSLRDLRGGVFVPKFVGWNGALPDCPGRAPSI